MARAITLCVLSTTVLLGACTSTPKATPTTTTTTVVPVPTTLPVTTTTVVPAPEPPTVAPAPRLRPAPTTTVPEPEPSAVPEPQVKGEIAVADNSTVSLDDPDMATWRAIALCEMPGPGGVPSEPWGAHWTFIGSPNGFSGAYGIANSTWRAFGGTDYGPTAGHATWQQQTIVARRIRDRYGYRAWGCGR